MSHRGHTQNVESRNKTITAAPSAQLLLDLNSYENSIHHSDLQNTPDRDSIDIDEHVEESDKAN